MPLVKQIEENQFEFDASLNGCTYHSMIRRDRSNPWYSVEPKHSAHDILHPDSKWIRLANLPEKRSHCVAVTIDETVGNREVLVIGGKGENDQALDSSTILYKESTNSWTTFPYQLNCDRRWYCQVAKVGSKIYVFGGLSSEDEMLWPSYEVLDRDDPPEARCWTFHTMPSFVSSNGRRIGYSIAAVDEQIFLVGGFLDEIDEDDSQATSDVFVLDTLTDTWSIGPQMESTRAVAAVSRLGDHLFVMGGAKNIHEPTATVERLGLTTTGEPMWLPGEPMLKPRVLHQALSVGDKLLIIGVGSNSEDGDFDREVWDGWGLGNVMVPSFTLRTPCASLADLDPPFASVMVGSDLMLVGGCSGDKACLSSVECLLSPHRVFEHQLTQIKSGTLLDEDQTPSGLWPYLFHRLGKKHLASIVFHFLREKNSILTPRSRQ